MKKINWHNPANATPPEGYRLLIPEEVDGRHSGVAKMWVSSSNSWVCVGVLATDTFRTYAVPLDTPLPEGYAVIDGEPWQMDGWTLNVPGGTKQHPQSHDGETWTVVLYRNGRNSTGPKKRHWFGVVPEDRGAEIIGWRVVEQEKAPEAKPMTATQVLFKSRNQGQTTGMLHKLVEDINVVLAENQRLKNELADAQATIKSIRSIAKEVYWSLLDVRGEVCKTEGYLRVRIKEGQPVFGWLEGVSGAATTLLETSSKIKQVLSL